VGGLTPLVRSRVWARRDVRFALSPAGARQRAGSATASASDADGGLATWLPAARGGRGCLRYPAPGARFSSSGPIIGGWRLGAGAGAGAEAGAEAEAEAEAGGSVGGEPRQGRRHRAAQPGGPLAQACCCSRRSHAITGHQSCNWLQLPTPVWSGPPFRKTNPSSVGQLACGDEVDASRSAERHVGAHRRTDMTHC